MTYDQCAVIQQSRVIRSCLSSCHASRWATREPPSTQDARTRTYIEHKGPCQVSNRRYYYSTGTRLLKRADRTWDRTEPQRSETDDSHHMGIMPSCGQKTSDTRRQTHARRTRGPHRANNANPTQRWRCVGCTPRLRSTRDVVESPSVEIASTK